MAQQVELGVRNRNPDVLTSIANLSNDEVFTPPEFANRMLDTLAEAWSESNGGASIWEDPNVTFLDPFTKSGVFLREITKRLVDGLEQQIPDLQTRVDHVLGKQVFGIAITELTALLARRSVYCSKKANGTHSIAKVFDTEHGNIWFERGEHSWAGSKCRFCGAAKSELDRGDEAETYAYPFIHTDDAAALLAKHFGADVKFDVIIGNPPYQLDDGGHGASALPIYQKFVEQAKQLEPTYLSVVIPARWYAGGKGLDEFRGTMLSENKIRYLRDIPNTADAFPGINNRGGVCYFLWDRTYEGPATVATQLGTEVDSVAVRPMLEPGLSTFIRYNEGVDILRRVLTKEGANPSTELLPPPSKRFSNLVSSRNPFGLPTNFKRPHNIDPSASLRVFQNGGDSFVARDALKVGKELIDEYKIFVSRAAPGSDEYPHLVLSKPIVALPGEVCTDTYIAIGPFESESEARSAASYMGTQFFRFLLSLQRVSVNVSKNVYSFVPIQAFNRNWNDADLYLEYGISQEEKEFISRFVKPVAWEKDFDV